MTMLPSAFADDAKNAVRLLNAAKTGDMKAVSKLLDAKVDVNSETTNGLTALHFAVGKGHLDIMNVLLARGAQVDSTDKYNNTPLHYAAASNKMAAAKLLISKGANVNARGKGGSTPLHGAISYGNVGIVELLLARGADVNMALKSKKATKTPLHIIADANMDSERWRTTHLEIIGVLLEAGANPFNKNQDYEAFKSLILSDSLKPGLEKSLGDIKNFSVPKEVEALWVDENLLHPNLNSKSDRKDCQIAAMKGVLKKK